MEKTFYVKSFNTSRELEAFVNQEQISREDIVAITQHPTPFTIYFFK